MSISLVNIGKAGHLLTCFCGSGRVVPWLPNQKKCSSTWLLRPLVHLEYPCCPHQTRNEWELLLFSVTDLFLEERPFIYTGVLVKLLLKCKTFLVWDLPCPWSWPCLTREHGFVVYRFKYLQHGLFPRAQWGPIPAETVGNWALCVHFPGEVV